ncbi:hypothetical protein PFISCL1PPCAC_858, partial [Pristionchus fissidentatus]
ETRRFMPRENAQLSDKRNYLDDQIPCHNDILSFSTNGASPVLAVLDRPLDVSEIILPELGVIYLDGDTQIGGVDEANWQCAKNGNANEIYFDEYFSDQDVYDPNTWDEMNVNNAPAFVLHMNQVPGAADTVEIFERNLIHFKLYDDFAVKEWKDYRR